MTKNSNSSHFYSLCLLAVYLCFIPNSAKGHGITVFAWVEGTQVCTESHFTRKQPVRKGTVTMLDGAAAVLGSVQTDKEGKACFPMPEQPGDLLFFVTAGQGHKGEFRLPAALQPPAPSLAPIVPVQTTKDSAHLLEPHDPTLKETLAELVRAEVTTQLTPIRKTLAEQHKAKEPSWRDIFGGLGWIVGLAALALVYVKKRAQRQEK